MEIALHTSNIFYEMAQMEITYSSSVWADSNFSVKKNAAHYVLPAVKMQTLIVLWLVTMLSEHIYVLAADETCEL